MKDKIIFSLIVVITFPLMCLLFYGIYSLIWMIFKRITPEQAFIVEKLVNENLIIFLVLLFLTYPIKKILKAHKDKHRRHLNKLAEFEWLEQYGDDCRIR